jgi:hypothetical protein
MLEMLRYVRREFGQRVLVPDRRWHEAMRSPAIRSWLLTANSQHPRRITGQHHVHGGAATGPRDHATRALRYGETVCIRLRSECCHIRQQTVAAVIIIDIMHG